MTASARLRPRYSYAEYLAYERDSELKHEFDDGEIIAMAGRSRRHNALALRIGAALDAARKPGCVAFQSDQRIRVLATGKATYPDVSPSGAWEYTDVITGAVALTGGAAIELARLYDDLPG